MARLGLTTKEDVIFRAIGAQAYVRARTVADRGALADVVWHEQSQRASGSVLGGAPAAVRAAWRPETATLDGECACHRSGSCDHPAALLLLTLDQQPVGEGGNSAPARTRPAAAVPRARTSVSDPPSLTAHEWEQTLATWLGRPLGGPAPARSSAGLQFEVSADAPARVLLRLVVPGTSGWVRSNQLSWSTLRWNNSLLDEEGRRLLAEMVLLAVGGREQYGAASSTIDLTSVRSRRIWDLLAEANELGLAMVRPGKAAGPVLLSREPAQMIMRARREAGEVVVLPTLAAGAATVEIPRDAYVLVGTPPHGVIWWSAGAEGNRSGPLRLAPLAHGLDRSLLAVLAAPPVRIPAAHEERFLRHVYPQLAVQVQVVADDTITLPEVGLSRLVLQLRTLGASAAHGVGLDWSWTTTVGDIARAEPLWPDVTGSVPWSPLAVDAHHRADLAALVLERVAKQAPDAVEETPAGPRLASTATILGDQVVRFLIEVLPALLRMADVDVRVPAELLELDCHETRERPAIRFADGDADGTDWYDLTVEVEVGTEQVSFHELFVALAEEREFLLLPSGTFFGLDQPEFRQLRDLIAESRSLHEAPPGTLRVGRYQASLWTELADLGEITGAAAAWQRSIRELFDEHEEVALPAGLRAELRPYQHEGLSWLATRYDHDLGGLLADDMGLGKTVQTLALVCHAREHWDVGPFLVVAPASVVSNWVTEARRFTPDLDVRAVTQTEARRGVPLAEVVAGADIVVTSYTLFRLEYGDYELVPWGGLVLDEAQFVKNPYGKGFDCARRLPTPFKLAITGTPMENNLSELWSLCSITAPGIFPRLDRFTEYYRNPIERGHDVERLDQLRRRIRPFLLRRRKSDVAVDLPAKQEQVLQLELAPRHRKVYQTYLQRERQKVLGLLGDLEKNRFQIFRSLTLLRQAALDVGLVGYERPVPSTKLDHLVEQVTDLAAEGHRTLIFSQFTRFLSAARERLERAGVACAYLDGKTTDRAMVIDQFKNSAVPAFLISLKAGGFGLNLTEADYCILLDPWWNPATEAQAVDRIHRIGQTRPVMVYRYVAKETIEEKVMALKARKAELFRGVMDDGGFADVRLTAADIRALFD